MNLFLVARKRAGLSQMQAAIKSGISKDSISRIENDRMTPSLPVAKKLAVAYGCSLDELAGLNQEIA